MGRPGSSRPKKFKTQPSAGKVMATVVWDVKELIMYVHTCKVAMDAVERNRYELIPHPAYSPDLAPSDFFLFPNLKKDISGLHCRSDEEVVTAVEELV